MMESSTATPMDTETVSMTVSTGIRGGTDRHGNVLAYNVSDEERMARFLILGSEGGNFYTRELELRAENAQCITRLIREGQGQMVVETVVEVVRKGRCIRMKAALLVLALCCQSQDSRTKSAAFRAIMDVCSIPTHLFGFIQSMKMCHCSKETAGWGRSLRKAVTEWYNAFASNPQRLAMLVTKYRHREGWSHSDVLRLGHVKPVNLSIGFILRYIAKGLKEAKEYYLQDGLTVLQEPLLSQVVHYLEAVEEARQLQAPKRPQADAELPLEPVEEDSDDTAVQRMVTLIRQFRLLREHIPPTFLRFGVVWQALMEEMPLLALMRNLNRITHSGLLKDPHNLQHVLEKLGNREALKKAKIHPYTILMAWYTYGSGHGMRGRLQWEVVPEVCQALEQAFYAAFGNVQPTNKRLLIALDVSGSMSYNAVGNEGGRCSGLTARVASAAMSLVTAHVESYVDFVAFSTTLQPLALDRNSTLSETIALIDHCSFGGTDCSQPMLWAKEEGKQYDAFIIYTDCETWSSLMPPARALKEYRQHSGICNARLAVVGMSSSGFSLADPQDLYMLDVVGFDSETPAALQEFISGFVQY